MKKMVPDYLKTITKYLQTMNIFKNKIGNFFNGVGFFGLFESRDACRKCECTEELPAPTITTDVDTPTAGTTRYTNTNQIGVTHWFLTENGPVEHVGSTYDVPNGTNIFARNLFGGCYSAVETN